MNEELATKLAAARARMSELAERFIGRTDADLRTMREDLEKARQGDLGSLAGIRQLAHRMAGTGATLGFAGVADSAAALEALIETIPVGESPDAATWARIDSGIESIATRLRSVAPKSA